MDSYIGLSTDTRLSLYFLIFLCVPMGPLQKSNGPCAGCNWHRACFSCQDCGRKLVNTCLNIGNKPYCEQCGKSAFIKAMRKK